MSSYSRPSWLERLVATCFGLLLAAIALYFAVRLIEAIWVALVVIGSGVAVAAGAVAAFRRHRQGW